MTKGSDDRIRILAVDDELMTLEVYREFLSSDREGKKSISKIDALSQELFGSTATRAHGAGYDVTICRQGDEAVSAVEASITENDPFAIAFIDIRMPPGQDGIVTASRMRQIDPDIEIVIVTGFSDYDPKFISQKVPPAHKLLYLQKPIYPHEISQFAASLSAKWVMEKKMQRAQQQMEDRIRERTTALEKANQELLEDMEKRRQVEQALGQSEEKYRNIVENISDYVCVHDLSGKILETNLNFKQQLGYGHEDRPRYIQALLPENYLDPFKEYLSRIAKIGSDKGTLVLKTKKGQNRILEYKSRLCGDSSGTQRVITSARDATEQLQTQKALKESEMLFRMLFENAGDAIFIIKTEPGETGRILAANQAAAHMHGYTLDEILALNIRDLDSEEAAARGEQQIQQILGGEWIRERVYHRKKDGTHFPVEISAGLLEWEGNKYILAFDRNISEQLQAEENLRLSEEKYRLLIDNAQDAIFILQNGYIQFANPSTLNIFDDHPENLSRIPFLDLVQPNDRSMVAQTIDNCMQTAASTGLFSYGVAGRKDSTLWLQMTGVKVVWEGEPSLLCFVRDMTDTRQLEIQLGQVQKMEALGKLAGGIAHDFNNILSVILGNIQLLGIYLGRDDRISENINRVMQASHRAKELVSQILTFSRKDDESSHPVHIRDVVEEAIKLLRASTPSNIAIEKDFEKSIGNVMANRTQIQQVLLNLCSNAVHAMEKEGGTLCISLCGKTVSELPPHPALPAGEYVLLTISDTGRGIPDKILERIFDPYFTTKNPGEGTGLGLSIVHGIVKKLKGHIELNSVPGKGTVFQVFFPKTDQADQAETNRAIPLQGDNEHILLVDDEEMLLETLGDMLEDLGYRVTLSVSSREAFDEFSRAPDQYDLVITDLTMPQMNGMDLAAKITGIRPKLPVALHTGLASEIKEQRLAQSGIRKVIRKPALEEEFAAAIRDLLDN